MYFDFVKNELNRISREQEEKFESKECICSLSLRDLCSLKTAIFAFEQIENLIAEKIDKPYEKQMKKKREEDEEDFYSRIIRDSWWEKE